MILPAVNPIDGVIVSVLASGAVDRGFEPRTNQAKDYEIGMCCFPDKYTVLRRKSKDWVARNRDNVRRKIYPRTVRTVFSDNPTKRVGLVESGAHHHLKFEFSPWYSWTIAELPSNNKHALIAGRMSECLLFNANEQFVNYIMARTS